MKYKFKLSTKTKKYTCPGCGKRTFVPYVYTDNDAIVDVGKYGRCDRENNCAYHLHPKDDSTFKSDRDLKMIEPQPDPVVQQIYPDDSTINRITTRPDATASPFHTYCRRLGIPMEHLLKWGVYTDGEHGELTAFIFRDTNGKACNIKWFKFHENGHRDKQYQSHSLKQPTKKISPLPHTPSQKKTKAPPVSEKYLLPLFGSHLLTPRDQGRVAVLVESEKTAVISSWFYKHFDWLACGSANGLGTGEGVPDDFKVKTLYNRQVIWLADADKAGRSNSSIKKLGRYAIDYCVADLFPDRSDGYDIADAIEDGLRPDVIFRSKKDEMAAEDAEKEMYLLPKGCEWEKVKDSINQYRSFEYKGRLYVVKSARGSDKYYCTPVSNFTIRSLGHIESRENPRRLIAIRNVFGLKKELEVPTRAFASNTEFTVFIESEGNFQYDGTSADLKCIRSKIYDTMVSYKEVDYLGWRDGYFFYANGVYNGTFKQCDQFGFVQIEKNKGYFIPALSSINKSAEEEWEDEQKFVYVNRDVKLKDWADLFCLVHKNNGKITLGWFIASLFRDIIYRQFKFFPHLFLFGPPGTGKSQVGWSIRAMGFNGIKKPFNLSGGTQVAFHREFAHFSNFPAWFDEYDNSIDYGRVQSLKAAYDGAGHKKSVKDSDKRTKTVPVNSSCMISGQHLPVDDIALFKRVILIEFHQTDFSQEEKDLFKQLQEMENGGLSHITAKLLGLRDVIKKEFSPTFDAVLRDMIEAYNGEVEDRIIRNMCITVTTYKLAWRELRIHLPVSYDDYFKLAIKNVRDQMRLINRSNETNVFWDLVSYLIDQKLIVEEQDYLFRDKMRIKVLRDRGSQEILEMEQTVTMLYIRMTRVIPLYREHFKRQNPTGANAMDKNSLIHYLKHQKYYIGAVGAAKFETGDTKNELGSNGYDVKKIRKPFMAYVFNYDSMAAAGIELKRGKSDENIMAFGEDEPEEILGSNVKAPF